MSEFGKWSKVKARKPRRCQLCGEMIPAGEVYDLWEGKGPDDDCPYGARKVSPSRI